MSLIFEKYPHLGGAEVKGLAEVAPVKIAVKDSLVPRRSNARPIPAPLQAKVCGFLDEMLNNRLVESSPDNPHVSPVHLVHHPPRKDRLVMDYREVNKGIVDDPYPLPLIHHLHQRLLRFKVFSVLDLKWGFHNIPLHDDSKPLTGFAIQGRGVFRFRVLPFGIKVAPTIFQRIVESVLGPELLLSDSVFVFVDDIVIGSGSVEENAELLRVVLEKLGKAQLCLSLEKCQLFKEQVRYLGHIIGCNRLEADPEKVQKLLDTPPPSKREELVSFLAAAGYLREFLPHFAVEAAELQQLALTKGRFVWKPSAEQAYRHLKDLIGKAVSLSAPDPSRPFFVFTDASEIGVGCALAQASTGDAPFAFLHFSSKRFNDVQRRWSTTDREVFAVKWALESCSRYIKGATITVYTDHQALTHLDTSSNSKLLRYALKIAEFAPRIEHIAGTSNAMADCSAAAPLPRKRTWADTC